MKLPRKPVVVSICVGVGLLHLVTGPEYSGPFRPFITGYLIDILLPFSLVLLSGLGLEKVPVFKQLLVRSILVFSIGVTVEMLQFFGYDFLGSTFDPVDFFMYGLGVVIGIGFEKVAFIDKSSSTLGQPVAGGDRPR